MAEYPRLEEVAEADRYLICKWYRFLPSPANETEATILRRIFDRYKELGGFTPEISKSLGWMGEDT